MQVAERRGRPLPGKRTSHTAVLLDIYSGPASVFDLTLDGIYFVILGITRRIPTELRRARAPLDLT